VIVVNLGDSSQLTKEVLDEMGISRRLPREVEDSWEYLNQDEEMVEELGEEFVRSYISVKKVGRCSFRANVRPKWDCSPRWRRRRLGDG